MKRAPRVPSWLGRLEEITEELSALADPWLQRRQIEKLLRIGPRRAQQLFQPLPHRRIGDSKQVHRDDLAKHLKHMADGDAAYYERQRIEKVRSAIEQSRIAQGNNPKILVTVPDQKQIWNTRLSTLPPGVLIVPGEIRVSAVSFDDAGEKLLALIMAMGNTNPQDLDDLLSPESNT